MQGSDHGIGLSNAGGLHAIDGQQYVSATQVSAAGRAVRSNAGDEKTFRGFGSKEANFLGGEVAQFDAQVTVPHLSRSDELVGDVERRSGRDGEADALVGAGGGEQAARNPYQMALDVDQRPPGVAGIDRGVGLDVVFDVAETEIAAPQSADDAKRHGLADTVGIADRQYRIAHPQGACRQAERSRWRVHDPNHGQIGAWVMSDQHGILFPAEVVAYADGRGSGHDMVVGEDVALRVDDDPGTLTGRSGFDDGETVEVICQQRILPDRSGGVAGGDEAEYIDDGWQGLLHGSGIAGRRGGHRRGGLCRSEQQIAKGQAESDQSGYEMTLDGMHGCCIG